MSVSKTFQAHGIGRALLEAAIEWAVIHHFVALTLTTFEKVSLNVPFMQSMWLQGAFRSWSR